MPREFWVERVVRHPISIKWEFLSRPSCSCAARLLRQLGKSRFSITKGSSLIREEVKRNFCADNNTKEENRCYETCNIKRDRKNEHDTKSSNCSSRAASAAINLLGTVYIADELFLHNSARRISRHTNIAKMLDVEQKLAPVCTIVEPVAFFQINVLFGTDLTDRGNQWVRWANRNDGNREGKRRKVGVETSELQSAFLPYVSGTIMSSASSVPFCHQKDSSHRISIDIKLINKY